ncbi:MAG: GtrA family protein [Bacteroidia bacterium]|nr:GtrA family protein [Bacteroidia bacterium]
MGQNAENTLGLGFNLDRMKALFARWYQHLLNFTLPKLKFATTSSLATLVDYCLYLLLVYLFLPPVASNLISAFCGMVINFILQRRYVFILQRNVRVAFVLSIAFSLLGIALGTGLIYLLNHLPFFATYQFITKLLVTGLIFFYNFYTKRFAFERGGVRE